MAVPQDPENNEVEALRRLVDFDGATVLEIGSRDGRLTWRYQVEAEKVVAIDPFPSSIRGARENTPTRLRDKTDFLETAFDDFAPRVHSEAYQIAILSWAPC